MAENELDRAIRTFLADGNYASLDEWMLDSDYTEKDGIWTTEEGDEIDPTEAVLGAIEASGWEAPADA